VPEVVEPTEEPLVDQVDVLPKGADMVIPPALTEPTQPTQPETVVTPVASVPFQTSETPGWRSRRQ
jgi:cell envelope opacity-associated protein A